MRKVAIFLIIFILCLSVVLPKLTTSHPLLSNISDKSTPIGTAKYEIKSKQILEFDNNSIQELQVNYIYDKNVTDQNNIIFDFESQVFDFLTIEILILSSSFNYTSGSTSEVFNINNKFSYNLTIIDSRITLIFSSINSTSLKFIFRPMENSPDVFFRSNEYLTRDNIFVPEFYTNTLFISGYMNETQINIYHHVYLEEGFYVFSIFFSNGNLSVSQIVIVDQTPPDVEISTSSHAHDKPFNFYILSISEVISYTKISYLNFVVYQSSAFSSNITIDPIFFEFGEYNLIFTFTDLAGNSQSYTRNVFINSSDYILPVSNQQVELHASKILSWVQSINQPVNYSLFINSLPIFYKINALTDFDISDLTRNLQVLDISLIVGFQNRYATNNFTITVIDTIPVDISISYFTPDLSEDNELNVNTFDYNNYSLTIFNQDAIIYQSEVINQSISVTLTLFGSFDEFYNFTILATDGIHVSVEMLTGIWNDYTLPVILSVPDDNIQFNQYEPSYNLIWQYYDLYLYNVSLSLNDTVVALKYYQSSNISLQLAGLPSGTYIVKLLIRDLGGNTMSSSITLTIFEYYSYQYYSHFTNEMLTQVLQIIIVVLIPIILFHNKLQRLIYS